MNDIPGVRQLKHIKYYFKIFSNWQAQHLNLQFANDPNKLFFAKALAHMLIFCSLVMVSFTLYAVTASPQHFSTFTKVALFPIYAMPVIVFAYTYKKLLAGRFNLARGIFCSLTTVTIILSISFTGGFFHSVASPFLIVAPLLVFLFYGMRQGALVTFGIPAFVAIQTIAMHYAGFNFPNFTSLANPQLNILTTNLSLYVMVIAIIASYEYQRNNLRKAVRREREKLAVLANRDPLTNLFNSRHLYHVLEEHCSNPQTQNDAMTVLYLDLDKFKFINDKHGHQAGDAVLLEVALRIADCVQKDDLVARLGGDEFIVLMRGEKHTSKILNTIKELRRSVRAPIFDNDKIHQVGISIGNSTYPSGAGNISKLMQLADRSMYKDKNNKASQKIRDEIGAVAPHLAKVDQLKVSA